MQPNQNPYEFILDPASQKRSGPSFLQNPKQRNIIAALFVLTIVVIVIVIVSAIFSGGGNNATGVSSVALNQTEIIRLTTLGLKDARDPAVRSKMATLQSFMSSDYAAATSYLGTSGVILSKEQLASAKNANVETQLTTAAQRNQYDEVLLELIDDAIGDYKSSLTKALDGSKGPQKQVLLDRAATNIITFEQTAQ